VLERPGLVRELLLANGPYWPVYRYFADANQLRASGAPVEAHGPLRVPPWFRADWADPAPRVAGIEPFLHNPAFYAAARALYAVGGQAVIRPQLVYVNLMLPMAAPDRGHVDIPAFRGIGRERFPVWLLSAMGHSGLFEAWRIRIATAVSWWSSGSGESSRTGPTAPGRTSACFARAATRRWSARTSACSTAWSGSASRAPRSRSTS
jgi:hypothetical protein